jgi:putative peptidoglycan lipid II flippase
MIETIKKLENNFSLGKATVLIGSFALLSRVAGLLRDMLLSSQFGAGDTLDIYTSAFRLPDFIFNLLVLGTLSAAFIPVFLEKLSQSRQAALELAAKIFNLSLLAMGALCLLAFFLAEPLTRVLVPGFAGEKLRQTVELTRLFLLSPVIFTAANVFTSILHSLKRFFIVSLAPVFYNLGIIFGIFFLYPKFGLWGLGWGVVLGALIHCLIQAFAALASGFRPTLALGLSDPAVKKITRLFLPRILGIDMGNFSLIISTTIGSVLPAGSIAAFTLANNLQTVPLGLFAFSTAVATFPLLSEQAAKKDALPFLKTFYTSVIQILFFILPLSAFILLHREYIVRLIFGYGLFDWNDTVSTFSVLGALSFSLFAQSLTPLFARGFYSLQNTITPVIINLVSLVLNGFLAWYLPKVTVFGGEALGIAGVAWAFSLASIFNASLLYGLLRKNTYRFFRLKPENFKNLELSAGMKILRLLFATFISAGLSLGVQYGLGKLLHTDTVPGLLLLAALVFGSGLFVYFTVTYSQGFRESQRLLKTAKFW